MKVLYITYDGLLDPLGGSQILPYIKGISNHQELVVVLSFEKPNRFLCESKSDLLDDIETYEIIWKPLKFTDSFGFIGKLWDLVRMYFWSFFLTKKYDIQVIHARSHIPAQVATFLKYLLKRKFIFDFRGLWVDERVDKGSWNLNHLFHRIQYKYFKMVEKKMLNCADKIVVLTEKVVNEIVELGGAPFSKVIVIPCCADFNHFVLSTSVNKLEARSMINIPKGAFVLGYLGSVGNMYILDRLFYLFNVVANIRSDCHLMIITPDVSRIEDLINKYLDSNLLSRVHIKSASRNDVPLLLPIMDIMVSFIHSSYARMASSPTKIAECFSAGIPIIANSGVGDVNSIVNELSGGIIIDPFSNEEIFSLERRLDEICAMGGQRLRDAARPMLGLELAYNRYKLVYETL